MSDTESVANKLYFGDNLDILREHVADESVDLIYLDPPFNSNATYNVLFRERSGDESAAQITAFDDTWRWGSDSAYAYQDVIRHGPSKVGELLGAMYSFLGQNDMMAYLTMMSQRLIELHRVLKPTGSIYLHCDPTASHYLKLLMDATFGVENFRSDIVWRRTNAKGLAFKGYPRNNDFLLYYTKSEEFTWNRPFRPYDPDYVENHYRHIEAETRRRYTLGDLTNPNRNRPNLTYEWNGHMRVWRWTKERMQEAHDKGLIQYSSTGLAYQKRYLDEMQGNPVDTIWEDVKRIGARAQERLGYPTQKPEALLERIINASSKEGDVVLDPFCGCGTAIAVAEKLNRRWIGIDITHLAISLIRHRLQDSLGDDLKPYEVVGDPKDVGSADALAKHDRYQFEWWALGLIDARPANDKRKGADSGVDGYINFFDDNGGVAKRVIVQVKSGRVNRGQIATLKGDMEREGAEIGLFVTLKPATEPMRQEALSAGFYEPEHYPDHRYHRVQILTIADLLSGDARAEYPRMGMQSTFKRAPRYMAAEGAQVSALW